MKRLSFPATVICVVVLASSMGLQAAEADDLATRVNAVVLKLDSDDYTARQKASDELAELPAEALPLLQAAMARPDISDEVRSRIQEGIPPLQHRLVLERLIRKRFEFFSRTSAGAYDNVGDKNPTWDSSAREALVLASQLWSDGVNNAPALARKCHALCQKAFAAGCNDPLLRYTDSGICASFLDSPSNIATFVTRAEDVGASKYPASRKLLAFVNGALTLQQVAPRGDAQMKTFIDGALGVIPEAMKDKELPKGEFIDSLNNLCTVMRKNGNPADRLTPFTILDKQLAISLPEDSYIRLCMKGYFFVNYAWDARGGDWASQVTPEGWAGFNNRLATARTLLEKAWDVDPTESFAPTQMLTVVLGQGGDNSVFDQWFSRAIATNPDNDDAVQTKYEYLDPKWHGSKEEQLAFLHELVGISNGESGIAFRLVDYHWNSAMPENAKVDETPVVFNAPYYARPDVWTDIQSIFEPYVRHHPTDMASRSCYARYAWWTRHWDVADRQFQILGEDGDNGFFGGPVAYNALRADMHERLAAGNAPTSIDGAVTEHLQARLKFTRSMLCDAYETAGRRNEKWDPTARQGLDLMARFMARDPDAPADAEDQILSATQSATNDGCDDPAVLFIYGYIYDSQFQPPGAAFKARSYAALAALRQSGYPIELKYVAMIWAAAIRAAKEQPLGDAAHGELVETLRDANDFLAQVAGNSDNSRDDLAEAVCLSLDTAQRLGLDRLDWAQRCLGAMRKAAGADDRAVLLVEGNNAYWKALAVAAPRLLSTLSAADRKAADACLDEGEKALTKCWRLDPNDPAAPVAMFNICSARMNTRPVAEAEIWLRRALDADPNNYRVCASWERFLFNGGQPMMEKCVRFSQQCVNSNNYKSRLPVLQSYMWIDNVCRNQQGTGLGHGEPDHPVDGLWWQLASDQLVKYLAVIPEAHEDRSNLAKAAFWAGQWGVANDQFKYLGDRARVNVFDTKDRLDNMRAAAAKLAPPAGN